jgi:dipeptidase D
LRGGHSGIDINKGRANANKALARILHTALTQMDFCLVEFKGGTTHNAIARDAKAKVALRAGQYEKLQQITADIQKKLQTEYATVEKNLKIDVAHLSDVPARLNGATVSDTRRIIDILMALPHGVNRMSIETPGLVDTSNNLAIVSFSEKNLHILSSQRSVYTSRVEEISAQVAAVAQIAGATVKTNNAYPAWEPKVDSALLKHCQKTYVTLFNKQPVVEIIHAGLECAVIGNKYPDMDMISIGPTMENPHSPDERLYLPSVEKLWQFIVALLSRF